LRHDRKWAATHELLGQYRMLAHPLPPTGRRVLRLPAGATRDGRAHVAKAFAGNRWLGDECDGETELIDEFLDHFDRLPLANLKRGDRRTG
jgi:hypothetical protein